MKKVFAIIYSIIASLILIVSISFFAVSIYNEKAHGELRTQVRFEKVVSGVKSAFEKNNITNSEKSRQIENTIGDTNDFAYINIACDGKTFYLFPEDFDASDKDSSRLIIPYNRNLNINGSKITISSGMYSIRPSSIFENAKISFIIILIVTLITIILIIYNNHFAKNTKDSSKVRKIKKIKAFDKTDDDEDFDDQIEEDKEDFDNSDNPEENDYTEEETVVENKTSEEENNQVIEDSTDDQIVEEEKPESSGPEKEVQLPVEDYKPVEIEEEKKATTENGLFSPDTGLGWESYLMTRLENELNRATASELDLALFIIKLQGLGRKNPLTKKICDYLALEFQFKDLLFEYQDDSICGIKISMDIDNAVTFAEKLVSEIKKIAADENPLILAGVTTRGIRMVSGERLLKEAGQAVKHAAEDLSNPVVGFRADAVKYRKFLEKN